MTPPRPQKRYRCCVCGLELPAWLPSPKRPDGAMLLGHLSQQHPTEVGPFLAQMRTEDITSVAAQAFKVRLEHGTHTLVCRRDKPSRKK